LEEVERIIGVTKVRVRQIQIRALGKIRSVMEGGFAGSSSASTGCGGGQSPD
jgi:hypothetical protein